MFVHDKKPTDLQLTSSYVLRTPATEEDIRQLAAFNQKIHGDQIYGMTYVLIKHHPNTRPHHWLYVCEKKSGKIVSSLFLIPWTIELGPVLLRGAELGIVGTSIEHRGRKLIKMLMQHYKKLVSDENFDLSLIQGIPYFYRQFGYSYAVPLDNHIMLMKTQITKPDNTSLHLDKAVPSDIPLLTRLHREMLNQLDIHSCRDESEWEYILTAAKGTETDSDILLIREQRKTIGYLRIHHHGFSDGLIVAECSPLSNILNMKILQLLAELAHSRQKPRIRLNLYRSHPLSKTAFTLGATDEFDYGWQLNFDPVHILKKIKPTLENRIRESSKNKYTGDIRIIDYRKGILLKLEKGRIIRIENANNREELDFNLPPDVLTALIFGFRNLDDMSNAYPDCMVSPENREWCRILFPKQKAYFFWPY